MEVKVVPGIGKLVEVVASGIGGVAGSMLAPWRAGQESKAREITARGNARILEIQAEAQKKARQILVDEDVSRRVEIELAEGIRQRVEYQEHKRQANITAVVGMAAQQLEEKNVPAAEPNHDWTARFFGEIKDVSSEEMQVLWGRILAGEVQRPGTTSMRTLGILKDMDTPTARLFSRFCSAAIYLNRPDGEVIDARVPSLGGNAGENSLADYGFGFGALNRLNEHGLIIADYNSYFTYGILRHDDGAGIELHHQGLSWDCVIEQPNVEEKRAQIHGVAMTVAGSELSRFVSLEPMDAYTKSLQRYLRQGFQLRMEPVHGDGTDTRDDG